MNLNIIRTIF